MVGLDAAGKTTILYKLKLGEIVTTIPTIGKSFLPNLGLFSCFVRFGRLEVFQLLLITHRFIRCALVRRAS